jgi:ribosome maturation factor RimP
LRVGHLPSYNLAFLDFGVRWDGSTGPFFLLASFSLLQPTTPLHAHPAIATAVSGLGYDLVDVERAPRGLLRVTIDLPWGGPDAGVERFVTVEDCERVTRQLQHVLEVEAFAYERLEVSSPGLDRPIRTERDFERFAGSDVELVLKEPFHGRKRWTGALERAGDGWRLVLPPPAAPKGKPGAAAVRRQPSDGAVSDSAGIRTLDFVLAEVRDAKLVPVLDFKGRRFHEKPAAAPEQESVSR